MPKRYAGGVISATKPSVTSSAGGSGMFSASEATQYAGSDLWPGLPGSPIITSTVPSDQSALIYFTAPVRTGGSAIATYTVTSNPGNFTASGSTSPITITGLTNGTNYTFTITAKNNANLTGIASSASQSVTPNNTPTPTIDYVMVGGGGGGSINNFPGSGGPGGACEFGSNVAVGSSSYTITVGNGGAAKAGAGYGNGSSGGASSIAGIRTANGGEVYGSFQTRTVLQNGTTYTGNNASGGSGSGNGPIGTVGQDGGLGRVDGAGVTASLAASGGTVYGVLRSGSYRYGGGGGNGNGGVGIDGGGNGSGSGTGVQAGTARTGGGGGGGTTQEGTARAGGSGSVVIRYPVQYRNATTTGSPTVFSDSTYKYYTFTGNGSITF